jgi:hypothetical protein
MTTEQVSRRLSGRRTRPFVPFNALAALVAESDFAPATRQLVAERFATQLADRYPGFDRQRFLQAAKVA